MLVEDNKIRIFNVPKPVLKASYDYVSLGTFHCSPSVSSCGMVDAYISVGPGIIGKVLYHYGNAATFGIFNPSYDIRIIRKLPRAKAALLGNIYYAYGRLSNNLDKYISDVFNNNHLPAISLAKFCELLHTGKSIEQRQVESIMALTSQLMFLLRTKG